MMGSEGMMGESMMWGMSLGGAIFMVVVALLVVALIKYVFFR